MKADQPIILFVETVSFRWWLEGNHATHDGIWMKIAKKGSGVASITYAEALDEALCFGWIDGQKKIHDAGHWLQKFTRRGPRSVWSKINIAHVERLTNAGLMQAAGQAVVDAAKVDGRWERAYHSSSNSEVPADFIAAVGRHAKAKAFFESLNKANRYAIYFRLTTAKKPETRARRFAQLLEMMKRCEKIH